MKSTVARGIALLAALALGVAADMVRGSVVAQDEAVAVDDGRREAFDAAYEAIEGRRGFCLKCIAELERQCSSA